jgi:hypothetical protein
MTRDKAYLVGVHRYSFRSGKPAEIIGVEMVTPENEKPRLCYHIMWSDKVEDWIAVEDSVNYKIVTFEDILVDNIPIVTQ